MLMFFTNSPTLITVIANARFNTSSRKNASEVLPLNVSKAN